MVPPARRPTGHRRPPGPWKNGPLPVIGLVGGVGAGKSTAAAKLEALGAFVIDADKVGHALLTQRPVRGRLIERFGLGVLGEPGADGEREVDRRTLAAAVFSDPMARRDLESIMHPRMAGTFAKAIARVSRRGVAGAVVLDAAVLFEAGWDRFCDRVLFIDAPREVRLERLQAARGWDEAGLASREAAQWPLDRKAARADGVIVNTGEAPEFAAKVERVYNDLLAAPPTRAQRAAAAGPAADLAEGPGPSPPPPRGRRGRAGPPGRGVRPRGR